MASKKAGKGKAPPFMAAPKGGKGMKAAKGGKKGKGGC